MTRYLSLAEFWYLAEYVTGIDAATLVKASRGDVKVASRGPVLPFVERVAETSGGVGDAFETAVPKCVRRRVLNPISIGTRRTGSCASTSSRIYAAGIGTEYDSV